MSPEEYWDGEGIRFLNEDGTLPSVEQRVKAGFIAGYDKGYVKALVFAKHSDTDEIESELMATVMDKVGRKLRQMQKLKEAR